MDKTTEIAFIVYQEKYRAQSAVLAKELSVALLEESDALAVNFRLFFEQQILKLSEAKQLNSAVWVDFSMH